MALYKLIESPDGVQRLVYDMKGHEDCKILEEGVTAPKVPGCVRENGRWKIRDKEVTKLQILAGRPRKEIVERLLALEARLDKAGL